MLYGECANDIIKTEPCPPNINTPRKYTAMGSRNNIEDIEHDIRYKLCGKTV